MLCCEANSKIGVLLVFLAGQESLKIYYLQCACNWEEKKVENEK